MALLQTLMPARVDLIVIQGTSWFVPMRVMESGSPVDVAAGRSLVDTTGWTARMHIRPGVESQTIALNLTTANGRLEIGFSPQPFDPSASVVVGELLVPTELNGFIYDVTVSGTLGGSEPTYPLVVGDTVASGTATIRCLRDDAIVTNLRIVVPEAVTSAAVDWGVGVYDLELINPFGHVTRLLHGSCQLSREITR